MPIIGEKYIRAVDLGTSGPKSALVTTGGEIVDYEFKENEVILLPDGGANSDIWCQIQADVFNRTIKQVKDPIQANLKGAAFLAAVSLGYLSFDDNSDRIQIANIYTSNPKIEKFTMNCSQNF